MRYIALKLATRINFARDKYVIGVNIVKYRGDARSRGPTILAWGVFGKRSESGLGKASS